MYEIVTVTGKILRDGAPAVGRAILTPNVNTISDIDGNVVLYGPLVGILDNTGAFSIEAPATDDPNLRPDFGYTLKFDLAEGSIPATAPFGLPVGTVTIDITDILPEPTIDGYIPVTQGPQGIQGIQGEVGPPGPSNVLTPGTVTTVPFGTPAAVDITGVSPNQTIDFTIPAGPQGIQGIQGPKGDPGTGSVSTVNGDPGPNVVLTAASVGAASTGHTHALQVVPIQAADPGNPNGTFWYDTDELDVIPEVDTDVIEHKALIQETHTRSTTNTYTAGKLTQVVEKAGATTVRTTTLNYTGEQLTSVVEVANGKTITTTLVYTGSDLTSTTRAVV